jgi:hypothetical protein
MSAISAVALAVALLVAGVDALASDKPPLPFHDWNACPFECCTYRAWRARAPVKVYQGRSTRSEIAFEVAKGQWVRALTGVVVTYRYGVTKVLKPIKLGYRVTYPVENDPLLSLQPGELLYTLHYLGEGFDLFWYKGQLYSDQIASREPDPDPPPPELNLQVLSRPRDVWWAKVRLKDGRVGWTNEPHKFGNIDACG